MTLNKTINLFIIVLLFLISAGASFAVTDNPIAPLNDAVLIQDSAPSEFIFAVFGDFRTLRRDRPYLPAFKHILNFPVLDHELVNGKSFKDRGNRDFLHSLFAKNKVKAVFAGHEHLYNDSSKDGVRYVITGGGGSPLYEAPQKGGLFSLLAFKNKRHGHSN